MSFKVGDQVSLKAPLPYLKTADSMPMLRPPDLVSPEEVGRVKGLRALGVVEVLFRRGCFLISEDRLKLVS
ncbi:NAD(P)H dehydrogenase assembly family protein [Prochlorococcus sp. MIT 1341]|uniref:NAD(P)H dehydrogenase assembly family protein n=1 Tax=Prochlorococcus sp. MIT 1341 TaxID=3096221 RepID=UPI002A74E51F|nr:NAD(P)H dehydrogenase assembly family protein [Prochlorococcus sp. MIT 1341]